MLLAASLILALSLFAAATLPLSAPATPPESAQLEAEASEEEGEEGAGEEETESEEEAEEGEGEEFGTGHAVPLPAECTLRSAEPSIAVQHDHQDVRLTIRYAAEEPTRAGISYWLKGGKGSLQLGSVSRRLGERGVVRLNTHLDERETAKARAARAFLVNIDLPDVPSYCSRYLTLHLTAKHQLANHETWSLPLERRRR